MRHPLLLALAVGLLLLWSSPGTWRAVATAPLAPDSAAWTALLEASPRDLAALQAEHEAETEEAALAR